MPGLLQDVDPDGLLEYSVVFTDRSLNHMSQTFQSVMRDISDTLQAVYSADAVVVVPGGGTYGMESVARQFAAGGKALIVRNGYFSYRWSQILEMGGFADEEVVLMARRSGEGPHAPFVPPPAEEVAAAIREQRPSVVFAPHVETSAGMLLPDTWLEEVCAACRAVDALMVLDGVASGTLWVDMRRTGVDVLISAPQKGWSASPCSALVMLGERAIERLAHTSSTSFAADLKRWHEIMQTYVSGGHAYHATMPTDALVTFAGAMREAGEFGFDRLKAAQLELGGKVRAALEARGFKSVAAEGFQAPGVVVSFTDDPALHNGSRFAEHGVQIAAGVPLMVGEGDDYKSFRIGLFGFDKLKDIDGCVERLSSVLDQL